MAKRVITCAQMPVAPESRDASDSEEPSSSSPQQESPAQYASRLALAIGQVMNPGAHADRRQAQNSDATNATIAAGIALERSIAAEKRRANS